MQANSVPSAKPYNPTTFQERGVVVPFTTPLLGGTRCRLADRGLELIVRNPAGGRGVYVMPWTGITSFCRPTLYDRVLNTRLAFLEKVTPATVRHVARTTAGEGLAGEAAMEAARTSVKTDQDDRSVAYRHLLETLTRQVNVGPGSSLDTDLEARTRHALALLAPRLGLPPAWGINAIRGLADTMACVGVTSGSDAGRVPRLITLLRDMSGEIAEWIGTQRNGDRVAYARMICSVADIIVSLADDLTAQVRIQNDDMVGLLRTWAADPDSITRLAERPEWVLDGWEQICLIWNHARDNAARRAALVEISEYVPIQPREVSEWSGCRSDLNDLFLDHRPITLNEDWRTGATVHDLIARNELFRAVAS